MALRDRPDGRRIHRTTPRSGALRAPHAGHRMRHLALFILVAAIAGCATRQPAPVVDRQAPPTPAPPVAEAPRAPEKPPEKPIPTHIVKRGETLVSIALQYGLDYRDLAAWNGLTNVNVISVGQTLLLGPPGGMASVAQPTTTPLATATPLIES